MARVEGLRALEKALQALVVRKVKGFRRGLYRAGLALQRESQEIVPLDEDALRLSAFTRPEGGPAAERGDGRLEVRVGYTKFYAVYQHEVLWYNHAPGRVAKFLEWPARYMRDYLIQLIVEDLRQ